MIIQAISLLDDLDKELNTYAMRVREWYGWHFPELAKIIQDNIQYAKTVKLMGYRINAAKLDFSEVDLVGLLYTLSKMHLDISVKLILFYFITYIFKSCRYLRRRLRQN